MDLHRKPSYHTTSQYFQTRPWTVHFPGTLQYLQQPPCTQDYDYSTMGSWPYRCTWKRTCRQVGKTGHSRKTTYLLSYLLILSQEGNPSSQNAGMGQLVDATP